jgi:D-alanine transaminase
VPVLDRGFIFGDGIYEVVPVYARRPFRWPQHLARLKRSLAAIGIDNPHDDDGWTKLVTDLVARHEWPDQFVYMQVTRGVARRDHAFPRPAVRPTVFGMSSPLVLPAAAQVEQGVAAITLPDERWLHCDIKSTSLLGNVLAREAAVQAGAAECVMFRDGYLTEGSASNIWVARGERLYGPPTDNLVLQGVRYGLIQELCAQSGIELHLRRILREEVQAADELILSSATKEVLAITSLDGRPVGTGRPGPVFANLYAAYQQVKARLASR